MSPVEIGADRVENSERIGPVAAIMLQNIQFVPDHFLRREQVDTMAIDLDGGTLQPAVIHGRTPVCHGPNDIDNGSVFPTTVDPLAVIRLLLEVVDEAQRGE